MDGYIFICYARIDWEFVRKLAANLKSQGVPVWLDQWDIPPGVDWDQSIDSALHACAHFLIVLSPVAIASREVRGELRTALDLSKPVVPVLYQPCEIPRGLRVIEYADFTSHGADDEAALNQVIRAVRTPAPVPSKSRTGAGSVGGIATGPAEQRLRYLDFELEVSPGSGRDYPVALVRSPAGEGCETMRFPFDELALENRLQALQIAILRSGGQRRQMLSTQELTVQDFGQQLFDALLTGEVRSRYDVSRREAAAQDKGLRLKLRIQSPELAALPWEFLYDSHQGEYVCLSRDTPLVRYLELPQPIQPLTVTPPLRILGMVASLQDLPVLDVEREKQRVEAAIKGLQERGLVDLTWLEGQTWRDLQRAMRNGPWHVFHFIGHGGFNRSTDEGFIVLADDKAQPQSLRATELGRLLADHRSLRLVVLNACEGARGSDRDVFSSTAAILVRRGIPAVLAMQYEITDRAAIEFARAFYEPLAENMMPVDAAVAEARKAMSLAAPNTVEWGTPVLYMRSPDGVLFHPTQEPAVERKSLPQEEEREQRWRAVAASRLQMEEARTTAEQAGARERQAEIFATLQTQAEQGGRREEQGDLTKAQIFYKQAARDFARLSREAETERERLRQETIDVQQQTSVARGDAERVRLREHVLEARHHADQTQTAAEQAEALQYAGKLYQQAMEAKLHGEQSLAAQQWKEAAGEFVRAQELFAQASHSTQREKARQAAAVAHERMGEARAKAEQAKADERFTAEFVQAQQLAAQGHTCAEREEFVQAVELYEQTEQHFVHLLQQAIDQAAQEGAESARRQVGEVKERVCALRPWAESLWTEAQKEETQTEQAYQIHEYEHARAGYEHACQAYERVGVSGEHERLRQEVFRVQRQALAVRAEAEQAEAERYAVGPWSQAIATQGEADQRRQVHQFVEAAQGYGQAKGLFQQATEEARRERPKQAAAAVRLRLEEVRTAAERAEARERFGEAFTQAQRLGEQGRVYEEQGDFAEAVNFYEQAEQSFAALCREAVLQAAQERAEAARQRMEEVKQGLEALMQWTGPQFAVAQQREVEAERAWQRQDYEQATALLAQTRQSYEAARVEAEQEQARQRTLQAQREQAEQAKTHTLELRGKAGAGRRWLPSLWWQSKQADRALSNGDRLFQKGKYTEARERYRKAASLFVVLQPREPEPTKTPISWKRSRIWPVVGAVLIMAAFCSLYFFRAQEREPTDGSPVRQSEEVAKAPLPPVQEIPSLTPKDEPPARLPEPEVPSTPFKEEPSAPDDTQETKSNKDLLVFSTLGMTKSSPEQQGKHTKPRKPRRKHPPSNQWRIKTND